MNIDIIGGGPGGLYTAILMKKADPSRRIRVFERNGPADTFGWGVVFSDETLGGFREADEESYARITDRFAHWDDIDIFFGGEHVRSSGHGFAGIARVELLQLLQERAASLGIEIRFHEEVEDPSRHLGADLVVAADGINSRTRQLLSDRFRPSLIEGASRYMWLGTEKLLPAFTFIVVENDHGVFQVHAYRFNETTSTFIVETDEASFRAAGLHEMSVDEGVRHCEALFAPWLDGHELLTNKSAWLRFVTVRNETWHHENVVLIGDAAHTAHFSIGSGTKLAMEDAIELDRAFRRHGEDVRAALAAYQEARHLDVLKLQRTASHSQRWFEEMPRHVRLAPRQFAFSLLSRSKKITHENLRKRDAGYVEDVDRWFASRAGDTEHDPPPPPMFTPFELRGLRLANRVVVSPMCQYSAVDGTPGDWHLVHLGSRGVGGAGLVMAEMTAVAAEARISPGCAGLYRDEHVAAWRRITDFVHASSSAAIGIQLGHAGRKGSTRVAWEGMDEPLVDGGWPLLAPSPVPYAPGSPAPKEMDRADMDRVVEQHVAATRRARDAGFDLLEVHAAHGYLLSSFLSPLTNRRTDAWGGSRERRFRFPLEVLEAVRGAWPAERPLSVRISATDWLEGGFDEEDAVALARELAALGVDVVDVSTGFTTPDAKPDIFGRMFQVQFSERVRNEAGIPTIAVGTVTSWDQVNTILAAGRADLVALAREHLRDPYFTLRAATEQGWAHVRWPDPYLPARPDLG